MRSENTIGRYLSILLFFIIHPLLCHETEQLKMSQVKIDDAVFLDFEVPDSAVICFYKVEKEYSNTFVKINDMAATDTVKFRLLDSLIPLFKNYDKKIIFDRKENKILAYVSAKGDYIYISGGVVKSRYIGKEGLLLMIGHEIGHLFGAVCSNNHDCYKKRCNVNCKKCFYENCIAYEQQADYYATKRIIPDVLPANELNATISKGIRQIMDFITLESGYMQNGYHIDTACRKITLQCGYDKKPIPSCKVDYCIK